jgi:hypothetical protein
MSHAGLDHWAVGLDWPHNHLVGVNLKGHYVLANDVDSQNDKNNQDILSMWREEWSIPLTACSKTDIKQMPPSSCKLTM